MKWDTMKIVNDQIVITFTEFTKRDNLDKFLEQLKKEIYFNFLLVEHNLDDLNLELYYEVELDKPNDLLYIKPLLSESDRTIKNIPKITEYVLKCTYGYLKRKEPPKFKLLHFKSK